MNFLDQERTRELITTQHSREGGISTILLKILKCAFAVAFISMFLIKGFAVEVAEAQTPEIQEMARALGNDPLTIYNYVHDHIRHTFYFGSRKGAALTLLEKSGNDFDQCALLVALLRAAGFSPTYEFCLVQMPYEIPGGDSDSKDIKHWLGTTLSYTNTSGISTLMTAFRNGRGYPDLKTGVNQFSLHHVWVKLTVSGLTYYLDPAFKATENIPGISLPGAFGLSTNTLNTAAGGTVTTNYVQSLDETTLRATLTSYTTGLLSTINGSYSNSTVGQIVGQRNIRPAQATMLSTNRPFTLDSAMTLITWTDIPTNMMSNLSIALSGMTVVLPTPSLKGQRLSLTFDASGGANIWLDDTNVGHTNTTGGSTVNVTLGVDQPFGSWNYASNVLSDTGLDDAMQTTTYQRTNASYAILYALEPSRDSVRARETQLDKYRAQGLSDSSREVTTETLNIMGLNWQLQSYSVYQLLSIQAGVDYVPICSVGRMAQEMAAKRH